MKIDRLQRNIAYGIEFALQVKFTTPRDEMKVVRCILCKDFHNLQKVFKYLGVFPERYNKAIGTGILIELIK